MEMIKPAPTRPSKLPLLFIPIAILLPFSSLICPVDGQNYICFNKDGNFTPNETYWKTLDSLLGSINTTSSDTLTYGLFNVSASWPHYPDDIQVLGVCSGNTTGDPCRDCLKGAADQVRELCPTYKKATLFKDKCWIRYSNVQLYGVLDTDWYVMRWNTQNVSNWEQFVPELKQFLESLGYQAASGGLVQKYAIADRWVDLYHLYGSVQCSPDLSNQSCSDCVAVTTGRLPDDKVGAAVLTPSCQIRYQTGRIFNLDNNAGPPPPPPPPSPPPPPPPPTPPKTKSKTWITVGASSGSAVMVISILTLLIVKWKIQRRNQSETEVINIDVVTVESLQLDLDITRSATENFSEANKLGQGGFGSVFRGKLPSGQEIAVKRLSQNSGQGESEFKNEARLLSRLQHRNLVRLLGYCLGGVERLLVYEFVPNASLDKFIFDPLKCTLLDWDTRYKIITGITRGLLYLHEDSRLRIIHRDLKASNILLDIDMNPKISDFGMARLFELDETQADTNRIMGTYGYMAPEYASRGNFSVKSDVFSFGVLVLEIISGRRNLVRVSVEDSEMLIGHAWTNWREGNISDIVDPAVSSDYNANILRCIHIGLLCVQENAASRPEMTSVVRWLDHHSVALPVPTQPAFFTSRATGDNIPSVFDSTSRTTEANHLRNNTGTASINAASITESYPR